MPLMLQMKVAAQLGATWCAPVDECLKKAASMVGGAGGAGAGATIAAECPGPALFHVFRTKKQLALYLKEQRYLLGVPLEGGG